MNQEQDFLRRKKATLKKAALKIDLLKKDL